MGGVRAGGLGSPPCTYPEFAPAVGPEDMRDGRKEADHARDAHTVRFRALPPGELQRYVGADRVAGEQHAHVVAALVRADALDDVLERGFGVRDLLRERVGGRRGGERLGGRGGRGAGFEAGEGAAVDVEGGFGVG